MYFCEIFSEGLQNGLPAKKKVGRKSGSLMWLCGN